MADYDEIRQIAQILLKKETQIDIQIIHARVREALRLEQDEEARSLFPVEQLVRELETMFSVWIGVEATLEDNSDHEPWLPAKKAAVDWRYWRRYQRFLEEEEKWSPVTVKKLDELTDAVLGRLEDPERKGLWDRRGLVAGHVQSGKTSNFIGLICKAVDAGYKTVVVLAGIHNSLRSQTQERLDEGLLGYDSQADIVGNRRAMRRPLGVYRIDPGCQPVNTITTSADDGDFKKVVAKHFHIAPHTRLLFVIKKNATVLRNLIDWAASYANARDGLGRAYLSEVPLLVIDDEADHASVDTTPRAVDENGDPDPDHDPATINRLIRQLLLLFGRSAYVGYTATPFANIFIAESARTTECGEDLFPRSFIINLPAPSDYVGPVQVFGLAQSEDLTREAVHSLPLVVPVSDFSNETGDGGWMPVSHKKTHIPLYLGKDELPPSVKEAIRAFVLARAGRMARQLASPHNSMLIHVSRFTAVQRRVAAQVEREVQRLQEELDIWDGRRTTPVVAQLKELWLREFQPVSEMLASDNMTPLTWAAVRACVRDAAKGILVKQVNGFAGDVLEYREAGASGLNCIAIGGDKLSRGLTLRGLTVSYFLRAAKMYDTLMQMGRWFGYRPMYLDLCRLYTSTELMRWYVHITLANEELREMFDDMARRRRTPQDYGLRVRTHPAGLLITAAVKMRNGLRVKLSYEGDISETVVFDDSQSEHNRKVISTFIDSLGPSETAKKESPTWRGVSAEMVVNTLRDFKVPESGPHKARPSLICEFIQKHVAAKELTSWTVALISNSTLSANRINFAGHNVGLTERSALAPGLEETSFSLGRLVNPPDEKIGLSEQQLDEAMARTLAAYRRDPARTHYKRKDVEPTSPSGLSLRSVRPASEALLLIYPLRPLKAGANEPLVPDLPVIGFAVSFPSEMTPQTIDYVVNNIYWTQEYGTQ